MYQDRVRLAGRDIPLDVLRERSGDFADLFARARAKVGHGRCLCREPGLRLVIRRFSRGGRYHLACWPGEGEQHASGCAFHRLDAVLSGRASYDIDAIRESADGTAIRCSAPLTVARSNPLPQSRTRGLDTADSGTTRRAAVSLLGLLHWLWDESALTTWHPRWRRRSWWTCHSKLTQQVAGCRINGFEPAEILYVVPPYRPELAARNSAEFEDFRSRLGKSGRDARRGLMLGEIKDLDPARRGARFRLCHHRGALFATTALAERVRRSYRPAFAAPGQQAGARRVGLFLVEPSHSSYLKAVDLAAMVVTNLYVPADSSHEVTMADALTEHGRAYIKPLRYDRADAVFPDFVLTDTTPVTYVEVYGIHGRESYEQRKRVKQAHYRETGAGLLEWSITDPMPDLTTA